MQKIFPYLFVNEPKTPKFSDLKAEFSRKVRKKLQINVQKKKKITFDYFEVHHFLKYFLT